ncbi:MAG: DUF362 domain-containing protein [Candidatus Aminicenantes bacterium]|nr:DUF362 domain-containing protein [Candidatus Aminicenantes bacterium]
MEKVLLRRVSEYDPETIQKIITEGIDELGIEKTTRNRITIKPNVVMAHPKLAPSAFTRPEFLDGLIGSLQTLRGPSSKITIAEKTGAGIPTSRMFRRAGYVRLKNLHGIKLLPLEEDKKIRIPLSKGTVHKAITTGISIADNDFLVYAPKLKSNVLSHGLTAALKLNIGVLLDRERMWNHNFKLDQKIADLLEVGLPDLVVTDAIEAAIGGNQMTQHGIHLGLIILARNPVAHDAVCAHILHLDPKKIPYLRIAHQRGYGPLDLSEISIGGDVSLDEIQRTTKTWDLGLKKVDQVNAGMKILCGLPYCSGGCHGVFLDWLYMIKDRKPKLWKKLPDWTVVIGKYKGDVQTNRLMKIGSCTDIEGKVKARKRVKIRGCPPKHKDLVLFWFLRAGVVNPLFRLDMIIDAYFFLFLSWCRRLLSGRL